MDLFSFLDEMANHIDWYSSSPSWFLSAFTDNNHARNWAGLLGGDVTVYKIDTTRLTASMRLFDIVTLNNLFRLGHKFAKDEVLFFGSIPSEAVVRTFRLGKAGSWGCSQYEPVPSKYYSRAWIGTLMWLTLALV